jgi:hypothetical protein
MSYGGFNRTARRPGEGAIVGTVKFRDGMWIAADAVGGRVAVEIKAGLAMDRLADHAAASDGD